jgi:hypothetical protein
MKSNKVLVNTPNNVRLNDNFKIIIKNLYVYELVTYSVTTSTN